ncbi:type VI secretion system protein ImpK [Paraburkholderia bannensis]|uniref:Type VI secretion system protein ImpK n=1 Tax=Paraburkholderia bannensis TaxID=765414 RepID=A0A7W9U370_9BURK|nr:MULTISPECIES: DotU family type IV/VI secretion system protein [Paraburkholderia]MBB3261165.1 type VI secretion system protein ImpK [Paraburkholderia sp. WP4_3_2]MBB6106202.1 type VI secretion system protein ImpK [Paraburkholderia bannensis]
MITLTLGRNTRPPTNPVSGMTRPDDVSMRDLLHDTALLVTSLSAGGTVENAARFRERCTQLVAQFADAVARENYPEDVRHEALLAQCGLLDEVALRNLPEDARTAWELHPMQVERFSIHDAGRRVIDAIEMHLHDQSPDAGLLECYAAILSMGFMGRYAREGETKRAALIAALDTRLQTLRTTVDEPFVTDAAGLRLAGKLRQFAPWISVAIGFLVVLTVWSMGSRMLDTQLAQIIPAKVETGGVRP